MAVDPDNHLLVTADAMGEMKTWLITGFGDGDPECPTPQLTDKPGEFVSISLTLICAIV